MGHFLQIPTIILLLATLGIFIAAGLIWLFLCDGIDKLKHPEEWKDKGSSGERAVWLALTQKCHIPENQILRNVYVPTKNGTAEIDLLIVSKRGLLVFECKNYSGNIYGDGLKKQWVQYIGKQKNFFYSPILQNRGHVVALRNYFNDIADLPIMSIVATTQAANWKLKNIPDGEYVLGWTDATLMSVYDSLSDSEVMVKNFNHILEKLRSLERPDEEVKLAHISQINVKQ